MKSYTFSTACGMSFNKKKTQHESICSVLGEDVSPNTCKYWFRQFKAGDFDVSDRARFGTLRKLEADNLQGLLKIRQTKNS